MNGKIILAILTLIAAAVGYVFYSSSTSEWNEMPPIEPEPTEQEAADAAAQQAAERKAAEEAAKAESEPEPVEEPEPKEEPEPEPEVEEPQRVTAPLSLNNSDMRVKQAVTDLAQKMVRWLTPPEQVRKWVLAVDLAADGKIPYKHSPIKYDKDPFLVLPKGEKSYAADSGNYSRWDALIAVLTDIPVEDAARYYREWLPLLERAYGELGKSGSFDQRFMAALGRVRTVSEPPAGATLVRPHVFYEYADPELEAASPLAKWMWRLGPENMLKLRNFARNLSSELTYR